MGLSCFLKGKGQKEVLQLEAYRKLKPNFSIPTSTIQQKKRLLNIQFYKLCQTSPMADTYWDK